MWTLVFVDAAAISADAFIARHNELEASGYSMWYCQTGTDANEAIITYVYRKWVDE